MLRPEAIRARLLYLEEVISRLEELHRADPGGPAAGFRDTWAVERGLQLAAETMFDIGNHILSAHFGVSRTTKISSPGSARSASSTLASTSDSKGSEAFETFLVHGYLGIDAGRVRDALRRGPADFGDFAIAIRRWLEQTVA